LPTNNILIVKEAILKAKVVDLVKKCYRISNKKVAINANIAILEANKATLRAKLCFITMLASFIYKDLVPFRYIIKLTPLTIIPFYIAFIALLLIKYK
jgi:hypothetical protein